MDTYGILEGIANRGIANQKRGETDYIGSDGILVCGVCGEPKQMIMELPDPTENDPDKMISFKVSCLCRCELEQEEKEKRREQARKDTERIASLRSASLMDERFSEATFDQFEINKDNERNIKLCRRYVERFDLMVGKNQGLLFWGDVGTGKTSASACIANALLSKKIPVMMTSFVKLLSIIQSGEERDSAILIRMKRAKLVIFDDLGAERGTEYGLEKVYGIVDARYRQKLPMIFTTNLTLAEMKAEVDVRYSRIYDRIFENCFPMQFVGKSWRRKEANRRYEEMEKLLED